MADCYVMCKNKGEYDVISKYIFDIFSQSCFDTSAIHFAAHLSYLIIVI